MWHLVCDLFTNLRSKPKRKPIMITTAWATYNEADGSIGRAKFAFKVYGVINAEAFVASKFGKIVETLEDSGILLCGLKLITREEYEQMGRANTIKE